MSGQTTMNGRHSVESPAAGVGRNVAGLTHDLISLAELQTQLVMVDVREGTAKCLLPIALMVGAVLLALGTMPVVLLGIGWALVNLAGFSEGGAFLLVSVLALAVAAGSGWWSVRKLQSAWSVLSRSRQELSENIRWIKRALKNQHTPAETYRRHV